MVEDNAKVDKDVDDISVDHNKEVPKDLVIKVLPENINVLNS